MSGFGNALSSSIGKKYVMGITGIFLILFLIVHAGINALIFINDNGLTFNIGAHFMATNWIIRAGEYILFLGLILHIYQALILTNQNRKARPERYAVYNGNANSKWYSRSMGLLGTLLLIFLVIHLKDFWVVSRFTGIPTVDANGHEDLYAVMREKFQDPVRVAAYVLLMISLCYHLMHGFASAFQTMGWNHSKYNGIIKTTGVVYSIVISVLFAVMPIAVYTGLVI
ncbi:succinate dehydrogenase cytochrome b subunit [Pedobacter endophyticus]|uniref:Succinate dehydrogenase cytochrome b subunit n=1 Tax=Pedobacter endophyticus TaxID=2789740 RepID=A0A7U3Q3A5_9SPHI|nr:succinate dehydrogenase cytochrome b subunit [Pedobacter endophyticus]QPH37770.1 succinate dehydrogenase cytochrome b subunit [Pedobacter endophyticus]